jgi:A/G-specific adenine glycosylase
MLQQTQVARVLPVWEAWLLRWPTPTSLADERPAEVLRAWGRLGYPRRAVRLHQAAVVLRDEHHGSVPSDAATLRTLPGVGEYTAAAVAAFAFGARHAVLDTNVRRVLARVLDGQAMPTPGLTNAERARTVALLPADGVIAAQLSVGLMELGALVCSTTNPECPRCPLRTRCAWRLAGAPPPTSPTRRAARYQGSDRQARGALLDVLRRASGPVPGAALAAAWPRDEQRERAVAGLLADGLAERTHDGALRLPDGTAAAASAGVRPAGGQPLRASGASSRATATS